MIHRLLIQLRAHILETGGGDVRATPARAAGVRPFHFANWFTGKVEPRLDEFEAAAKAVGLTLRVRQVGKPDASLPRGEPSIMRTPAGAHWAVSLFWFHAQRHGVGPGSAALLAELDVDKVVRWFYGATPLMTEADRLLKTVGLALELREASRTLSLFSASNLTGIPKHRLRKAGIGEDVPVDKLKAFTDKLAVEAPSEASRPSKITIPKRCHPFASFIFAEMQRQGVTYDELQRRSGVLRTTFKAWRTNNKPGLDTVENALAALGWRLSVAPIDHSEGRPGAIDGLALPRPLAVEGRANA